MTWQLAEIRGGPCAPRNDVSLLKDTPAVIPFDAGLLTGLPDPPAGTAMIEYRTDAGTPWRPLVWKDQAGNSACALRVAEWLDALRQESYRPPHPMPFRARLPVNYHRLPSEVRVWLARFVHRRHRGGDVVLSTTYPMSQFNVAVEFVMNAVWSAQGTPMPAPVVVLTHDIETANDFPWAARMADVEEELGFRSSWNFIPKRYRVDKKLMTRLVDRGHEICIHGIWHNNREAFVPPAELRKQFTAMKPFMSEYNVAGFRSPSWYRTTVLFDVLSEFFDYDMSCLDVDVVCPGGHGGVGLARPFHIRRDLVELPVTLGYDALVYSDLPHSRWIDYWRPKIDFIRSAGAALVVNSHPEFTYCGNEPALGAYRDLLHYVSGAPWRRMMPRDAAAQARDGRTLGDYLNPVLTS